MSARLRSGGYDGWLLVMLQHFIIMAE